ncbi:MAG: response regulator [Fibrobacterota bacterium]|nr:response regulator [Fibrobacterota bacterium]
MVTTELYEIIRDIVATLSKSEPGYQSLPAEFDPEIPIADVGLDMLTLPEVLEELKSRLDGKDASLPELGPGDYNAMTLGDLLERIRHKTSPVAKNPIVVYVDDEEENLFVFKRRFGKDINLKTFSDSEAALEYIKTESDIGLVITDEVMPNLNGNALCSAVRKSKPYLKFILITGNPQNDQELMYKTLRQGRFYEFINKPLDMEKKGAEYLALIRSLLSGPT